MALSARVVFEVRDTGSDTDCSGGYRGTKAVNPAPSTPALATAATGGSVAANTYHVVVTYTDPYGDTVISGVDNITTTGTTSTITVTSPAASEVTYNEQQISATAWNVYVGLTANGPFFPQGTGLTLGTDRVITTTPPTTGTQPLGDQDYSQQDAAQVVVDGATISAVVGSTTTHLVLTGHTVSASEVGNLYNNTGGTSTAGLYEIIGIVGTDTWLMDRSLGTAAQTSTGAMGGAFASIGKVYGVRVLGNKTWLKRGTADAPYDLSNTANVSGGKITSGSTEPITIVGPGFLQGYDAVRGDRTGNRPKVQPSANNMTCVQFTGTNQDVSNIDFENGNANTTCTGLSGTTSAQLTVSDCDFTDLATGCSNSGGGGSVVNCKAIGTTLSGISGGSNVIPCRIAKCVATGCSGNDGISLSRGIVEDCVSYNNTCSGFRAAQPGSVFKNCTSYGNTGASSSGFAFASPYGIMINCIAVSNGLDGFTGSTSSAGKSEVVNCAAFGNAGDAANDCVRNNFITLSADPFIDAANGDFRLNDAAGGGALLKGKGFPQFYPGLETVPNFPDIGAYQSPTPIGESGSIFTPEGPLGSGSNKTSQDTVTVTSGITALAGQLIIILVATDNEDTSDGATSLHVSCTVDSHGATKLGEFTNGEGAAGAGVTTSVWYLIAPADIDNGSAVVATLTSAKTAKAVTSFLFDWDSSYSISSDGITTLAADAGQPGSLAVTPTLDVPHLLIRAAGGETSASALGTPTPTAGWSLIPAAGTAGGAAATNVVIFGEYKVVSGTAEQTSNPTGVTADWASVLVALAASLEGGIGGGGGATKASLPSGLSSV